jgi:hypothetical protein
MVHQQTTKSLSKFESQAGIFEFADNADSICSALRLIAGANSRGTDLTSLIARRPDLFKSRFAAG